MEKGDDIDRLKASGCGSGMNAVKSMNSCTVNKEGESIAKLKKKEQKKNVNMKTDTNKCMNRNK